MHGKCGGIKGSLALMEKTSRCGRCCDGDDEHTTEGWGQDRVKQGENGKLVCELGNGEQLEVVSNFCYLGDTTEAGAGVEAAVSTRIKKVWYKFRQLGAILTRKGLSLKVKGRVYDSCMKSTLLCGSKTWAVKVAQVRRLERTDMQMVRWIAGQN